MKDLLDRHEVRMSAAERGATWEAILAAGTSYSRPRRIRALSTAAATLAAAALTLSILQRDPAAPYRAKRPGPVVTRDAAEPASPHTGVRPETSPGTPRPIAPASPRRVDASQFAVPGDVAAPVAPEGVPRLHSAPSTPPVGPGVVTGRVVDEHGQPVPYANVVIEGMRRGALTDENGVFRIDRLPPAEYSLRVQPLGYEKTIVKGVKVAAGQPATADVQVRPVPLMQISEMAVGAPRWIDTRSSTTKQSISAEKLREVPVDDIREAIGTKAGVVAQGGELHFRGGRPEEVKFQFEGVQVSDPLTGRGGNVTAGPGTNVTTRPAPPPVIPYTGGTTLPNDEPYDAMFFRNHGVNPFVPTDEDPLSTFAVDVDAASYTVSRRYLELGHLPPPDAVRVEEFVNFFPQGYPSFTGEDFRILVDGAPSPFGPGCHLLRVGLKGREVGLAQRLPAQLTFVIDVSGSMAREDRLGLVKAALRLLVDQLRDGDRVGVVVYGSQGRVLLEPVGVGNDEDRESDETGGPAGGRRAILAAIDGLRPDGSTNAEEGLRLGYDMARRAHRSGAINRIVLCSDGVANVGRTGPESILARVRTEADRGIHLTTIGFGMGNYNDVLMEQLADKGDGNYYYVDDLEEARRVFVENLTGTLQTIAKDAKIQVEFDSTRVLRYRLLGFENRDVADRDFRNDRVDAGEIGAGHEVTALYEVKLAPRAESGRIMTVRLRYARPEQDGGGAPVVREIEKAFGSAGLHRKFEDASPHFRLDAAVAEFAEILRGSYWARGGRLSDVLSVARSAAAGLHEAEAAELVSLVGKAAGLKAQGRGEEK